MRLNPDYAKALRALVREARIVGALEHPNIVPVHALGRDDNGQPRSRPGQKAGVPEGDGARTEDDDDVRDDDGDGDDDEDTSEDSNPDGERVQTATLLSVQGPERKREGSTENDGMTSLQYEHRLTVLIALSYGSKQEITAAVRDIVTQIQSGTLRMLWTRTPRL